MWKAATSEILFSDDASGSLHQAACMWDDNVWDLPVGSGHLLTFASTSWKYPYSAVLFWNF